MTRLHNRLAYEAIGLSQKPSLEWSCSVNSGNIKDRNKST